MKKVAIYYIATSQYIIFFDEFIRNINNFLPGIEKKIILITDSDNVNYSNRSKDDIEVQQKHIDHHYWPIIALFKMYYIDKFFDGECDYHFYFNANMIFYKELILDSCFDLYVMNHYCGKDMPFMTLNRNKRCIEVPRSAECYIDSSEILGNVIYCQTAFFGGKTDTMKHMLSEVNNMLRNDLSYNIIADWHDETYFNKYMIKNYWNSNRIEKVSITNMAEYARLLGKGDYFNKFEL